MTEQQEFCCKEKSGSVKEAKESEDMYLLCRLVEHLALRRKRSRTFDEIVKLLATLEY
jgi:hypothetical protein